MANTLQILRSQVTATPPGLTYGAMAYSEYSSTLFVGDHTNSPIAVAGPGTFATLASPAFTGAPTAPTPTSSDNSTKLATTAYVQSQAYITGNQAITLSSDATGSGTTAISVTLASVGTSGTYTKVTTDGKGRVTAGTTLSSSDVPQTLTHAWLTDFTSSVEAVRLDQMTAPTSGVSWNSQSITNLATPVNPNDAATKAYVDASAQGLDVKQSVMCATTANITLSGLQTIDGYTTLSGDRVLVKAQSSAATNGIYLASSSTWTRAGDFNSSSNVLSGSFTFVEDGTADGATSWVLTTTGTITVGTTALSFAQFGAAGSYSAGNGLALSGSSFAVVGTANVISVSGSGVTISSSYVGQTSITTLGTITTVSIDLGTF